MTPTTDSDPIISDRESVLHASDHEQNDNWVWSDTLTEQVLDRLTDNGLSLKVGTGLRPICDVNLDIADLRDIAESDNAEFTVEPITDTTDERIQAARAFLQDSRDTSNVVYGRVTTPPEYDHEYYDGYAALGDMYDLPFEDNAFDAVVSDPPWLDISQDDRRHIFNEVVRVTKPTGVVVYNATWVPGHEFTNEFDLRFRQQQDFWGGPSFVAYHRRTARSHTELFNVYDYKSAERYPDDSPFWSEDYPPDAVLLERNTNPHALSTHGKSREYQCPKCGHSRLFHVGDPALATPDEKYNLYECEACQFRATEQEIKPTA